MAHIRDAARGGIEAHIALAAHAAQGQGHFPAAPAVHRQQLCGIDVGPNVAVVHQQGLVGVHQGHDFLNAAAGVQGGGLLIAQVHGYAAIAAVVEKHVPHHVQVGDIDDKLADARR